MQGEDMGTDPRIDLKTGIGVPLHARSIESVGRLGPEHMRRESPASWTIGVAWEDR